MSTESTPDAPRFSKPIGESEFARVRDQLQALAGIQLHAGKRELVQARLGCRMRVLGLDSYAAYLQLVEEDLTGRERTKMVELLTTNVTHFFRERDHFGVLAERVIMPAKQTHRRGLRLWSAGCSSGEEAYSMAITLLEHWPEVEFSGALILATDLSSRVLETAAQGRYNIDRLKECPPHLKEKYFRPEPGPTPAFRVTGPPRRLVRFRRLNLMDAWPMTRPLDAIFCRNVMIYFNESTQAQLVERFYRALAPGGYLMVGHSESLTRLKHSFHYLQPSVYRKP